VDAVYWDLYGSASNLNIQSEYASPVQTSTSCSGYMVLPAAINIPGIEYAGKVITGMDYSLQRTSDGASTWFSAATTPTPRECNSDCVGPPDVSCFVVNESCAGGDGSVTVSILNGHTPPYTIQWLHPVISNQSTISGLTQGTYVVSVTDASGCFIVYDTAVVLQLSGPSIYNSQIENESCTASNGSIALTVLGSNMPFSYQWNSSSINSATLANLAAGNYAVTITDDLGCTDTMSFQLINQPGPEIEITQVIDEMCSASNGSISTVTTSGTPPLTYTWNGIQSPNAGELLNSPAGAYSVVVTDDNGCTATADTLLTNTPPPQVSFTNVTDETCHKGNGTATLHLAGGNPPYAFEWTEFPDISDTNLSNLGEGVYQVTVSDSYCVVNSEVQINNIPGPVAAFRVYPEAASIEDPRIVFYDESIGATVWNWDFGDNRYSNVPSPTHEYRDTGIFKVTLMINDEQGCMDSVSHTVLIISPITLFIPNAFTPDGNGLNDQYLILGQHITDFEIHIFNRWGSEVFHSNDMNQGWNGTFQGQPAPEGLYSWVLWYRDDYQLFQTDRKVIYGHVTLIR
jgi:gliding motility-associated-like protein